MLHMVQGDIVIHVASLLSSLLLSVELLNLELLNNSFLRPELLNA